MSQERAGGPDESFIRLLTAEQNHLTGYIATLMGNLTETADVLQQTNVVLWRKHHEFEPRSSFRAWARKVAHYQALAYIRDQKRDRHVFDDELLDEIASRPFEYDGDERFVALQQCLSRLPARSLELVRKRYVAGGTIPVVAEGLGMSEGAVRTALMRIRRRLMDCIERRLASSRGI